MYQRISVFCTFLTFCLSGSGSALAADRPELKENVEKLQQSKICKGCNLAGATLNRLELAGADLEGADLSGAKITLTNLSRANLRNANLRGTLFGGSDLSDADLRGADLRGASLDSSYHQGALFDGQFVTARPYVDVGEPEVEKQVFVADTATPKKATEPAKVAIEGEPVKGASTSGGVPAVVSTAPPAAEVKVAPAVTAEAKAPPAKRVVPPAVPLVDQSPQSAEPAQAAAVESTPGAEVTPRAEQKAKTEPEVKVESTIAAETAQRAEQPAETELRAANVMESAPMKVSEAAPAKPAPQPPVMVQVAEDKKAEVPSAEKQKGPEPVKEVRIQEGEGGKLAALLDTKKCYGCKLTDCHLARKNLAGADLEKADLSGCNLEGADLDGANLKGTLLRQANLKNASLKNADLYKADLTAADLTGAKVKGAMFDEARIDEAVGLKEARLEAEK